MPIVAVLCTAIARSGCDPANTDAAMALPAFLRVRLAAPGLSTAAGRLRIAGCRSADRRHGSQKK